MTLWAARTGVALDPDVDAFLRADDDELLPYDCAATAVHAQRLHAAGILDDGELADVETRLATIADEGAAFLGEYEDVHSAIEGLLGDVGRKIHAGRSRNDQVAAAARLYVQDACREADGSVAALVATILDVAEREATTPMPGYTHMQRAQPVTVGHHLHAWVEMLERDRGRFEQARVAAEPSPLGAGALAGSTLPLPLPDNGMRNSLDAVADRDFAHDRDLQEDKTPLFATRRDVRTALAALGALVGGIELDAERLAGAVADPLLRATDAAEALVREGVPFRDAHEQVAAAVRGGTFVAPERAAPRAAPGPGGVTQALRAARRRLEARTLSDLPRSLVGRDLTTLTTWTAVELRLVLDLAEQLKTAEEQGSPHRFLPGRTLGLLSPPPS